MNISLQNTGKYTQNFNTLDRHSALLFQNVAINPIFPPSLLSQYELYRTFGFHDTTFLGVFSPQYGCFRPPLVAFHTISGCLTT